MSLGYPVIVRDLRMGYGEAPDVLRGLSLDLAVGEAVALLGPNGVGKTTLIRLVAGLLRPRAGMILLGDWTVPERRPDEMARRVGYAFQHADQQLFERTVHADVAFGPRMMGRGEERVVDVLRELGLADVAGAHPYDLPAPARKLVTLAGVLATEPGLLLLDEPTAGMDLAMRDAVIAAIRRRVASGVTLLTVSHDLSFVAEIAERIVMLRDGVVAADSPARDLLTNVAALRVSGLRPPPAAAIGVALTFAGRPIRREEISRQLRAVRWRG